MKRHIIGILLITLLAASCKPAFVRKGLREIRCERARISEAQTSFDVLDTAQLRGMYQSYFAQIDSINLYFQDQYSDGAWQLMTEFGQIKKPLKVYLEDYGTIMREFTYSLQQLANLESDLREKLISKEQFRIYMDSEKSANGKLIVRSNLVSENAVRRVNHYQQISPKIDSLIMVFKAGAKQ